MCRKGREGLICVQEGKGGADLCAGRGGLLGGGLV